MLDWTWLGYAVLGLGTVAALASAVLAVRVRSRRADTNQNQAAADVQATISRLNTTAASEDVPLQLAQWEQHSAEVARRQLDMYLTYSRAALGQSTTSFRMGMAAASFGFLALLGSLAWLLAVGKDIAWLGVISGAVCEAVAALFFTEARATRARTTKMFERVQAEADRVVRARSALAVVQSITDLATRERLLADIGRWLLGGDGLEPQPEPGLEPTQGAR